MDQEKLHDAAAHCPHCGHTIHFYVDLSEDEPQNYEEECPVCGDILYVELFRDVGDDKFHVRIKADDEQYY